MRSLLGLLLTIAFAVGFVERIVSAEPSDAAQITVPATNRPLSFNRDIRPILTDRCFACHGLDANTVEAGLRLDVREAALEGGAIVPGDAESSEIFLRITSDDDDLVMPPSELHKPLSDAEIDLVRRWIQEGAPYEPHWAYTPLPRNGVPPSVNTTWGENWIDQFVARRLQDASVTPSPQADPTTLIRRLSFDLTGLPPTPEEVEAFKQDNSNESYERLIDRLLSSSRFGERMAIYWLDLVRYADTVGYHGDQNVSHSPYRDYVIDAFNSNMPYDQFVREQLAGDLLPNPTIDQLVASGYNRLNQTTEEGGAQPKEYLSIYFADRVRNVSQVFMGATVGCAQCHDHKYDPYTAKDFYSLGAFFADIEERGKYSQRERPPQIPVPNEEQQSQLDALRLKVAEAQANLESITQKQLAFLPEWEAQAIESINQSKFQTEEHTWVDDQLAAGGSKSGEWNHVTADQHPVHSGETSRRQTGKGVVQHLFTNAKEPIEAKAGTELFAWVYLDPQSPPKTIMLQWHGGPDDSSGWDHRAFWGDDKVGFGAKPQSWHGHKRMGDLPETGKWIRLSVAADDVGFAPGKTVHGMAFTQFDGIVHWDQAGWNETDGFPSEIRAALLADVKARTKNQIKQLRDYFVEHEPLIIQQAKELKRARTQVSEFENSIPTMVISRAVVPREIRILDRGNWMDESGEIVQPAIPEFLGTLQTGNRRATRLDLANWLCDSENVLTARTMVNRLWYLMFGRGICSSVDDLGGQGTFPSHPELLDHLAVEFIESGWDIQHLLKQIAMSATYRQASNGSPELNALDPFNELFARQGRFRVSAEMVRDTALMISGLLVEEIGGPSVKPYQPEGYYSQLNFPRRNYVPDQGDNQYRRGVYTHWQRTFLHPMLKAFDAPSREECTAIRARSNTPLQALTLLNDPTFIEAATMFASRIMREGGTTVDERIEWAYRTAVSRPIDAVIAEELRTIQTEHLRHYAQEPDLAKELVSIGEQSSTTALDPAEWAAWTSVARVILNLHETINRY
ncbi:PSD1 and planctomycete cytochrome C domain-containing protein [Rhodopirellula baltica]|uniref:Secreted protein containing planctomycete cytochrome C domain n=1 Tax=Rhodopirellula baltica WH47 TaxID=991778 RepID=F2B0R4_RHOBT|nr:PSD1 and planctomycete cytochrome C domain-containing protein [Rhodopirellula baltica]EGF24457.1 secreted protein containing planctomycete cytochrome C domain [Rhodopirellula baltica WH47]